MSRQSDVYAASVVLWEALTSERLFSADNPGELLDQIRTRRVAPPSELAAGVPATLDAIVLRGLARDPADRFATAREMAVELERSGGQVSAVEIGEWVERIAKDAIATRAKKVAEIEHHSPSEQMSVARSPGDEAAAIAEARQRRESAHHHTGTTVPEVDFRAQQAARYAGHTDASIASIAKNPSAEPRSKRARLAAAGAALALLVVAGTTIVRSSRRASVSAPAAPSQASIAEVAPAAAPAPSANAGPAAPAEVSMPEPEPPLDTVAKPARADAGSASRAKPAPRHPPKKTVVDCSFPYIIDVNGIQHIRKECLN
jgi:serine/threonine-protein kinase